MSFCRGFVVSHYQKASFGNAFVLCFRKLPFEKHLLDKLGRGLGKRGVSQFSVEILVSCSTEKIPWVRLLCCGSENFRSRKIYWISWEGGWGRRSITVFCQNLFSFQRRKTA